MRTFRRLASWGLLAVTLTVCPRSMHGQEGEAALSALDSLLSVPVSAAARHAQSRSEAPASISVVTSEDIQRYGYRTLEDVFRTLPGFYVSNDRNYSYVGTRGFSRPTDYNNRVLLLVDGHTINDRFYGGAAVGSDFGISLDAVDRIELARGPASAVYGTGGMLAVINVVTKSAEAADGVLISAEAGNLGRHGVSMLFGQTTNSNLDITASFNWSEQNGEDIYFPEFDAPESNNGTAAGLDWERFLGGTAGLRYGSFEARGAIGSRSKGIPTGAWEMNFGDPAAETWDAWGFAELTYDWQMDPSKSLKVRAFGDGYEYEGVYPYDENYLDRNDNWSVGSELRFTWDPRPNLRVIAGGEGVRVAQAHYRAWDAAEEYVAGDWPYTQLGVYAQGEFQLTPAVGITAGLRHDAYSNAGGATSPRVALIGHLPTATTVKLLYGEAFRAPSVWELEYHDPPSGYISNPGLGPEQIQTFEMVLEQRIATGLFMNVSLFHYEMSGLIDYLEIETPDSLLSFGDTMFRYDNVDGANTMGVEAEITAVLSSGPRGYFSYTYQDAKQADPLVANDRLSNSPPHLVKLGLSTPILGQVTVGGNLLYESGRLTVFDTETDDYFLMDLNVATRPLVAGLSFSATVKNVFNNGYWVPGGWEHAQPALPQRGREVLVRARWHWQ